MRHKSWFKKILPLFLILSLLFGGCTKPSDIPTDTANVVYGEVYTSKDEVAEYIYEYDELPINYITKAEAKKLGWNASEGNLWEVTDHKSIGGDVFQNREGLLPKVQGRTYYECDIDYQGGIRNAKRLVYSKDGYIYYTEDHYQSFEELYGDAE